MQTLYNTMVVVHVLSAILGMGPGFFLTRIVSKAKTMAELRHGYYIRRHLHVFVMVGGILLLVSGLVMGSIRPSLFTETWYIASLILYLIALSFGPFVLKPISKPIYALLSEHEGDDIPVHYHTHAQKLFRYERLINVIFLIIILLMITKPTL